MNIINDFPILLSSFINSSVNINMPGKVSVKIKAGRNLPVMDKSSDTTDAYVEIKLGNVTYKTDVCRKTLNPQWNTDWFRFEADDAELQDEPLQIRLMDYDTYSANDAIGKINISLNPFCKETLGQANSKGPVLSGWLPVFDTLHGIRGEVNVIVKVDLFSDVNKFRQSSCGIPFFHSQCVPSGYRIEVIHGFVEELVVNDDPEYQWIDKIRTPRASNEARQVVFLKLSGQVQRKMGLKAINMGANAVIGYSQYFDLEGDVGVVARGIGTSVTLLKEITTNQNMCVNSTILPDNKYGTVNTISVNIQPVLKNLCLPMAITTTTGTIAITENTMPIITNMKTINETCRRSSDSDLSITSRINLFPLTEQSTSTNTSVCVRMGQSGIGPNVNVDGVEMEYPFLTMTKYPNGLILHIGATVSARSVKLLERIPNLDEPELRDLWWTELRMEIKSHTRSLGCNVVLGYSELTTISEDVCVLSATGTAAIIDMNYNNSINQNDIKTNCSVGVSNSLEEKNTVLNVSNVTNTLNTCADISDNIFPTNHLSQFNMTKKLCCICHIPYNSLAIPFTVQMNKCGLCKKAYVPDVILATFEIPDCLQINGRGCFLQAHVVRGKKDLRSEMNAKEISDGLPFLEYELHRVLINKLKARSMNAIFGLKIQVSIGERVIALIATGTSVFLSALPIPKIPKIVAGNSWTDQQKLNELQKKLDDIFENSQENFQLNILDPDNKTNLMDKNSDTENSDDENIGKMDLNNYRKDACVLEVDDIEDIEIISLLLEPFPPDKFYVVNTQRIPNITNIKVSKNSQMFTQMWRAKFEVGQTEFHRHFQRLLQIIFYKLRAMTPCAICDLRFKLDFPDNDQIQLLVIGMALGLEQTNKSVLKSLDNYRQQFDEFYDDDRNISKINQKSLIHEDDYSTLPMDIPNTIDICDATNNITSNIGKLLKIPVHFIPRFQNTNVDITTLDTMPRGKIEKYLGNLDFFFIRESTLIRENGGMSAFVHGFITELFAIVRAHIAALGGNAMVSLNLTELSLLDNQHKNQGQCLISIGGDAVYVSYSNDE